MTPRERFIAALERNPLSGRIPHFELVFFLTMEAFGTVHPSHRNYSQWFQMTETERKLHRNDMAAVYLKTASRFEHSAIFIHNPMPGLEELQHMIDCIRDQSDATYYITTHGDPTYGMPSGSTMMEFSSMLFEKPQQLKDEAQRRIDEQLEKARMLQGKGLDGFTMCTDYCMNTGPFLSPTQFAEFVTPYLKQLIAGYRELGFYTIKHSDGNIMPIIDQLVECNPHALHSLDPQGGVDIKQVKQTYGNQVCLCGNVNCGLIDTGTDEEYLESVRYAITHGKPGGGYIFCTSNCIYTGMQLERYEKILALWREIGYYS
jgi:uroporphyrinogen decarboxylase